MMIQCGNLQEEVSCSFSLYLLPSSLPSREWILTISVGLSFGYNQNEDSSHSMSALEAIKLIIDISSKGGNVLLNVGPDADGNIPPIQMECLEGMAEWMTQYGEAVNGTRSVKEDIVKPVDREGEWVRWLRKGKTAYGFILSSEGRVKITVNESMVDITSLKSFDGRPIEVDEDGKIDVGKLGMSRPAVIQLQLR